MSENYRTVTTAIVQRQSDGAFIPNDLNNADYQKYQAWVVLGNSPLATSATFVTGSNPSE